MPAEANVIASAVFLLALVIVVVAQVTTAARRKRLAKLGDEMEETLTHGHDYF